MDAILESLELPTQGENYLVYKSRMEAIHGSEGDVPKAIKIKFFSFEASEAREFVG